MKIFILIILTILAFNKVNSIESKIIHKIQNEIITNIDIKNQFKYLVALNNSLKELDKNQILNISNESIIREKVKKIEISKNFTEMSLSEEYLDFQIKKTYLRLNLNSRDEFQLYLKDYNLVLEDIIKKISIDTLWNELIIKKYGDQVVINREKIQKEISNNANIQSREYFLAEIVSDIENKEEINIKYKEIIKSINEIGFENSASIYSFSDTAKVGGDIGWVNENSLNNKIKKKIKNLKIGDVSEPIILSNGILILQIKDTKITEIKIDMNVELKKAINYERNRQLNQFSKIYYNKVKKNLELDE
ncbi:peptidylprolyl isomerase [Pelagibacteraceae bacterium]|nr:peptidylprolyl isomerase [Pelagibacteraceae bacterium]